MFRSASSLMTLDEGDQLRKSHSRFLAPLLAILSAIEPSAILSAILLLAILTLISSTGVNMFSSPSPLPTLDEGDPLPKSRFLAPLLAILSIILSAIEPSATELLAILSAILLLAILTPHGRFYAKRSNEGESSGSGGRAGEERNGGGGERNGGGGGGDQGIGGGHREGIGNERRGSRGRSHGGGNGDDDDNDRRGWVGYIPMDPRPDRMAEILLLLNFQIFATVEALDITGFSDRARIVRIVSLGFTSMALVCLSASIRRRGTNPMLASILSWIGSVATFMGFASMIVMALLASFIP